MPHSKAALHSNTHSVAHPLQTASRAVQVEDPLTHELVARVAELEIGMAGKARNLKELTQRMDSMEKAMESLSESHTQTKDGLTRIEEEFQKQLAQVNEDSAQTSETMLRLGNISTTLQSQVASSTIKVQELKRQHDSHLKLTAAVMQATAQSIIRLSAQAMGEEMPREGMQIYLKSTRFWLTTLVIASEASGTVGPSEQPRRSPTVPTTPVSEPPRASPEAAHAGAASGITTAMSGSTSTTTAIPLDVPEVREPEASESESAPPLNITHEATGSAVMEHV